MNAQTLLTQTPVPVRCYPPSEIQPPTMQANVFRGPDKIGIEEVPRPRPGVGEAVIRITLTTICGTDLAIDSRSPFHSTGLYKSWGMTR